MTKRVAVVGLGAMGSMIMWQLARRGVSVTGFEALNIGSDRTGFGGDTRLFRVAYKEGAAFAELLERSRSLWLELNQLSGLDVFIPCGALTIAGADGGYMSQLVANVRASGVEHEVLDSETLRSRFPQHRLLPGDIGLYDPAGGVLRTDIAVLSAVEQAKRAGATVHARTPVDAVRPSGNQVEVVSGTGSWRFDQVVVCAGAWSHHLLTDRMRRRTEPFRILLTWYSARNPADYTPERFPAFIRDSDGVHMFGTPALDGNMVKAAGVNPDRAVGSLDAFRRELTEHEVDVTDRAVERFFPGLFPTCVRSDSYLDLFSEDMRPIVGWDPDRPGVYIATGFSGRGFKMATGVGETVAEEIATGRRPACLDFAAPTRFPAR